MPPPSDVQQKCRRLTQNICILNKLNTLIFLKNFALFESNYEIKLDAESIAPPTQEFAMHHIKISRINNDE